MNAQTAAGPNLASMTHKQLIAILKTLTGGRVGFDYFRDPRTSKKEALAVYIAQNYQPAQIAQAWKDFTSGKWRDQQHGTPDNTPSGGGGNSPQQGQQQGQQGQGSGSEQGQEQQQGQEQPQGMTPEQQQAEQQRQAEADAKLKKEQAKAQQQRDQQDTQREQEQAAQDERTQEELETALQQMAESPDTYHPLAEKIIRLMLAGPNVALVGPAGCGKTHLAGQLAKLAALVWPTPT